MQSKIIPLPPRKGVKMSTFDEDQEDSLLAPLPSDSVVPDEQRSLTVLDDLTVDSARVESRVYISLKALCQFLGVAPTGQTTKIRSKPILAQGLRQITLQTNGGRQPVLCLDADVLPLWLLDIHPKKAKPEFHDTLYELQIRIARNVRDAYYAYALARENPQFAYLTRLLEQILAEVHANTQTSDELVHVTNLVLQSVLEPRPTGKAVAAKPMLKLMPPTTQAASHTLIEGHIVLADHNWGNGTVTVIVDDRTLMVTVLGGDGKSVTVNPEQALQVLAVLQEYRGDFLQALQRPA